MYANKKFSPRTYNAKKMEVEKWVSQEKLQILSKRKEFERTWIIAAEQFKKTKRDLLFTKQVLRKAKEEPRQSDTRFSYSENNYQENLQLQQNIYRQSKLDASPSKNKSELDQNSFRLKQHQDSIEMKINEESQIKLDGRFQNISDELKMSWVKNQNPSKKLQQMNEETRSNPKLQLSSEKEIQTSNYIASLSDQNKSQSRMIKNEENLNKINSDLKSSMSTKKYDITIKKQQEDIVENNSLERDIELAYQSVKNQSSIRSTNSNIKDLDQNKSMRMNSTLKNIYDNSTIQLELLNQAQNSSEAQSDSKINEDQQQSSEQSDSCQKGIKQFNDGKLQLGQKLSNQFEEANVERNDDFDQKFITKNEKLLINHNRKNLASTHPQNQKRRLISDSLTSNIDQDKNNLSLDYQKNQPINNQNFQINNPSKSQRDPKHNDTTFQDLNQQQINDLNIRSPKDEMYYSESYQFNQQQVFLGNKLTDQQHPDEAQKQKELIKDLQDNFKLKFQKNMNENLQGTNDQNELFFQSQKLKLEDFLAYNESSSQTISCISEQKQWHEKSEENSTKNNNNLQQNLGCFQKSTKNQIKKEGDQQTNSQEGWQAVYRNSNEKEDLSKEESYRLTQKSEQEKIKKTEVIANFVLENLIQDLLKEQESTNQHFLEQLCLNKKKELEKSPLNSLKLQKQQQFIQKEIEVHFPTNSPDRSSNLSQQIQICQIQGIEDNQNIQKGIHTNISAVNDFLNLIIKHIQEFLSQEFQKKINQTIKISPSEFLNIMTSYQLQKNQQAFPYPNYTITQIRKNYEGVLSQEFFQRIDQEIKYETAQQNELKTMHNQLIFDAFNKSLNYFRPNGLKGAPMPWKISAMQNYNERPEKVQVNQILEKAKEKTLEWTTSICGFIPDKTESPFMENFDLDEEYLAQIRENRMARMLAQEVIEEEEHWINYEMEECEVQLELGESILDRLVLETIQNLLSIQDQRCRVDYF